VEFKPPLDHLTIIQSNPRRVRLSGEAEYIEAAEFYEQSNYYVDILKDDFCHKEAGGWFKLRDVVSTEELQSIPEETVPGSTGLK